MDVSPQGLAFIARHEGFVGRAYLDPAGVPTIGYGFTEGSRLFRSWWQAQGHAGLVPGQTIDPIAALTLLRKLLDHEYGPMVTAALGALPQPVFDAVVSVVYNLGPKALGWRWAKALKAGDLGRAAELLARTGTTAGGRVLPGLVTRRRDEAELIQDGTYGFAPDTPMKTEPEVKIAQAHLRLLAIDRALLMGSRGLARGWRRCGFSPTIRRLPLMARWDRRRAQRSPALLPRARALPDAARAGRWQLAALQLTAMRCGPVC